MLITSLAKISAYVCNLDIAPPHNNKILITYLAKISA